MSSDQKTFYIETFGCQMNFHDSEKVVGTLISQGYRQVQREEDADLIFYNTCSIRDKAEQKVFHRLNDFKKLQEQGKRFGVLGCVAQQEGEKIFERAPYVSLVAGSASYRNLPKMLVQIEAGQTRVTGLDDRQTDQTFETEFTARTNPHRGYITIIEGCDKFCAYCVVPYTRGKERSRTSESVLDEARRMADAGYHRDSTARAEREFLSRSGREEELRRIAGRRRRDRRHSPRALHHLASARFHQRHHRRHRLRARRSATTCTCRCRAARRACLQSMFREYTREQYLERIAWMKAARNRDISITTDIIVGFPGRNRRRVPRDACVARPRSATTACFRSSIRRVRIRRHCNMPTRFPTTEKSRRLQILQEHQREIQRVSYRRHVGSVLEVMVEGQEHGSRPDDRPHVAEQDVELHLRTTGREPRTGDYVKVQVTQAFPNSLLGEMVG